MSASEARLKANKKYHDKFDNVQFRVPKGDRKMLQDHAASQGESLNAFLCRAAIETIERDNKK